MNLPAHLLPAVWEWLGHGLLVLAAAKVLFTAPWRRLQNPRQQNIWLGTVVFLMLLWSLKTGVRPGLNFHLLGATAFTLMFGPKLAAAGLVLVLFGVTLAGMGGWSSFSINALFMAVLPVLISSGVYTFADRKLPNHFFVYIFVAAFLGAWLAMALTGLTITGLLAAAGAYPAAYLYSEYLPFFIFMGLAEALLTGMVMTLLVIYRPDWVATFDDTRYIRNK